MDYWNQQWTERIVNYDVVKMNKKKGYFLCNQIFARPQYHTKEKLEVGCGPGWHILALSHHDPKFKETWTGIDMSDVAVNFCKEHGLRAELANFYDYKPERKFDIFLFLDVLEHMDSNDKIAKAVLRLAKPKFTIFGNVPLYRSPHEERGGFERDMNITVIQDLIEKVGIPEFNYEVYGVHGWPYMVFEAEGNAVTNH